jgi:hypothetical protein
MVQLQTLQAKISGLTKGIIYSQSHLTTAFESEDPYPTHSFDLFLHLKNYF